ncbi:leucine-rich_repeat domain-containing protein [Hexamita inflata]|uniref:Leucine-rich repeat domain-containing protein n=1 Tax=Hexamita inflata TaxID=28002 RepID=A0AA86PR62_9EUKA|nr:leucine-rich repeat domain-containing protein [Hexamita inflata]
MIKLRMLLNLFKYAKQFLFQKQTSSGCFLKLVQQLIREDKQLVLGSVQFDNNQEGYDEIVSKFLLSFQVFISYVIVSHNRDNDCLFGNYCLMAYPQTKNHMQNRIKFHSNIMGSHLGQPSHEKENDQKSKVSQYNKTMIYKYQNQIREGLLIIENKLELKNLDFIRFLNVNTLVLGSCRSIIPKLQSQTIKQLRIYSYDNISLKVFQLDNLEVLTLQSNDTNKSKTLVLEIIQFQKLKELYLCGWITDISPFLQLGGLTKLGLYSCKQNNIQSKISQMTNLTTLALNDCKVRNASVLLPLIYLEELYLDQNQGIDITALQYLTKLTKLSLRSCDLVGLDSLMPLIKLKDLNIQGNKIIYITTCTTEKFILTGCKIQQYYRS